MKGLEALKDATELVTTLPELKREPEPKERERVKLGAKHKAQIAWLEAKGYGKWNERAHLFETHTCHVAELCEYFDLPGEFETSASGKDGASGRNCCLIPLKGGLWLCVRYNTSDEDGPGWKKNANGHMQCVVGKAPAKPKIDHADIIVSDAQATDAFFHWQGVAYVEVSRHDRKETLLIGSDTYARLLRVRYHKAHGRVCKAEWVKNATDLLCALAVEEGEEIPVYVRLAHVRGKLYIDLADRERHVVEIDRDGYRVVQTEAPARFVRTDKMLPLPVPQPGGTLEDLHPFVNVEDEDFPLLVGAILGMLQPDGTLPVLSIIGGDGRAKTCLAIVILMLIDPSIIKGCSPPENNEDLVLAVQQRWVYFIDNVSEIKPWLSDALCRLATGGATERRTKYKDRDTSLFLAKRPVLTTSIVDVVRAADLSSRTIKADLPSVHAKRKPEAQLWREFSQARPRILGALYAAVSAAIRNLPNTTVDNLPRLADWALWVTAAEPATGLPAGSILSAYRDAREAAVKDLLSSDAAQKVLAFAAPKQWQGTGKELAEAVKLSFTADREIREFVSELRTLQTALESQGVLVGFRRSHGEKLITITRP
ncbi:MAG: hypothetical protein ABR915_20935 [Thermoguttaceae bacterium]